MIDVQSINEQIIKGVGSLADAIGAFSHAAALMEGDKHPGMEEIMQHLVAASMAVPDTYWMLLLAANHVGVHEVRAKLQAAVGDALKG